MGKAGLENLCDDVFPEALVLDVHHGVVALRIEGLARFAEGLDTQRVEDLDKLCQGHLHALFIGLVCGLVMQGPLEVIIDGKELLHRIGNGILIDAVLFALRALAEVVIFCSQPQKLIVLLRLRGLGLLPTQTTFAAEKRRTQSQATVTAEPFAGAHLTGYEIHTGRTTVQGAPFCTLADGTPEGCVQGQVFGTYLHGLFDSGELTEQFAAYLCCRKGIDPAAAAPISMQEYRTQQLDLLADGVRHNLDLAAVYAAMGLAQPAERGNDQ